MSKICFISGESFFFGLLETFITAVSDLLCMILVIGAGGMGSVIAEDLSRNHDVTVIDRSRESLDKLQGIRTFLGDPSDFPELKSAELAVTALPSEVARDVVENLLKHGVNVVDISFTDYDPFELDGMARSGNAVYVPHAGFAPGLSNILAGKLYYGEKSRDIEILVGGLQESPVPPMDYRPTFNASSVIDEYTRPARYLKDGRVLTADPLESIEKAVIGDLGTLETFYSDGLATILDTLKEATVIEKTLRYPGHLDKMKFLRDMGYFSDERFDGASPRDISNRIFRNMVGDFPDLSILKVFSRDVPGKSFECVDHYDSSRKVTSMGRMTGYSASAVSQTVLDGYVTSPGVFATEWIGKDDGFFNAVLKYLGDRGISVK